MTLPPEPTASAPRQSAPADATRNEYGLLAATSHETAAGEARGAATPEHAWLSNALHEEYGLLAEMLASVWSASLFRVSLFLGVVSAISVALGFAAQAGGGFGSTFIVFALVALPLALFLGLATFARTVELQREAYVYITGMNRIRHAIADAVPATRPYFVLSVYDDALGVYRSQGTGIRTRPPRNRLVFALLQTQGIVAVICAALAGVICGLATAWFASTTTTIVPWAIGALAFVFVLGGLLRYWSRSMGHLQAAIRPMFPTPPESIDQPI